MSSPFTHSLNQFGGDFPAAASYDDGFGAQPISTFDSTVADFPPPSYSSGGEFTDPSHFSSEAIDNDPILPPPAEMEHEESYALREWRRQNTARLEEKEKRERELLSRIIVEADDYKVEFHRKRQITSETNRLTNREKEQVFVAELEKFYAEADKDYWKSIAELIPKEVAAVEKRRGGKEKDEKKASVVVVQGPKPGRPTDLSRMRQLLLKLKQNTPPHLNQSPAVPVVTRA
ncbi:clathrin light chain 2-like [Salvia hispanica]|uniref:clathrin light chain 2-like n=1 Tax=Salvia hispanica TaxID=49212 RepID=UPI0020096AE9|nr:clathrin light chain 2-like [Salvia hispanica]